MTTCLNCTHTSIDQFAFCPKCGMKQSGEPSSSDAMVGRTLNGKYRVLAELGAGSMGKVYLGEHISLKKKIALKVLHTDVQIGEEARQRFQREGIAAGQFTHPNAIQIFDFDMDEGPVFYLAMEYVDGLDLKRVIKKEGAFPIESAVDVTARILGALDEAHRHGIIHRDLKPENVMVVRSASGGAIQTVKVLDFGLSKLVDRPLDASLTEMGRVMGTPLYMSPEQVSGDEVDHRTDLYAVGLILYEMIAGKTPFSGKTLQEILGKHLKEIPPRVVDLNPLAKLSVDFDAFLARALAKDRADRFQSAEEMLRVLQSCRIDGEIVPAGAVPAAASPTSSADATALSAPPRSNRGLWIGLAVLLVAALAVVGAMTLGSGSGDAYARVRAKPTEERTAAERSYLGLLDAARADLLAGDADGAFSKVQEASRHEVADAEVFFTRGLVYRERADADTARVDFEEALRADATYGDAAAQLGWMKLEAGDRDGALEHFLEAARIDSSSSEALAGQGAVRFLEGKIDDAQRLLRQALSITPDLVVANVFLGRACLAKDEHEDAVDAFVRAKRSAPAAWEAYAGLGRAYVAMDRSEDAEQQFAEAIEIEPEAAEPRVDYATMLVDDGRFRDAVKQLADVIEKRPDDGSLHVLLGVSHAATGFEDGAVAELKKAIRLGVADAQTRALLGSLLLGQARHEEALVELEAALAERGSLASAHLNRGVALMELGRYDEAAEPLQRAAELAPDDPFPHLCLGALYMEFLGDPRAATDHLRKYSELGGDDERASQWLRQRVR